MFIQMEEDLDHRGKQVGTSLFLLFQNSEIKVRILFYEEHIEK